MTGPTWSGPWPYRWRMSSRSCGLAEPQSARRANPARYGPEVTGNPTTRDYNKASVLDVVFSRAPLTRNELIELTGLSKATVSRAVEELRADGFIVNGGVDEVTGRGRRSTNLDVPGTTGHVVGVSFGAQSTCVLVADLRGREVQHVIVPTVDHQEVRSAAAWLVDLITEASRSAEGPLRQIVVAVPGRVRTGMEIFGPAEAMKAFAGSGLQRNLADLVDAPVLLDSDANASLLGFLTEDDTLGNAALLSLSSILNFASCMDHEIVRGRTPAFGDIGVLFAGVDDEILDGLLSTSGLLRFARGRGLELERIEDLWLQPHDEVSARRGAGCVHHSDHYCCECRGRDAGPGVGLLHGSVAAARPGSPSRSTKTARQEPVDSPRGQGADAGSRSVGGTRGGVRVPGGGSGPATRRGAGGTSPGANYRAIRARLLSRPPRRRRPPAASGGESPPESPTPGRCHRVGSNCGRRGPVATCARPSCAAPPTTRVTNASMTRWRLCSIWSTTMRRAASTSPASMAS